MIRSSSATTLRPTPTTAIEHVLAERYLIDGGAGRLSIGDVAETDLGRRHFMELLAVFTAPPLFSMRYGRLELGLARRDLEPAVGGTLFTVVRCAFWDT